MSNGRDNSEVSDGPDNSPVTDYSGGEADDAAEADPGDTSWSTPTANIPMQMRNLTMADGIVTFTVIIKLEFSCRLTALGDSLSLPWFSTVW